MKLSNLCRALAARVSTVATLRASPPVRGRKRAMGSALLAIVQPERFTVIDYRAQTAEDPVRKPLRRGQRQPSHVLDVGVGVAAEVAGSPCGLPAPDGDQLGRV